MGVWHQRSLVLTELFNPLNFFNHAGNPMHLKKRIFEEYLVRHKKTASLLIVASLLGACGGSGDSAAGNAANTPAAYAPTCAASTTPPTAENNGTLVLWQIKPSTTSSCISTADEPHQVYLDSAKAKKNMLAIFLPGTGGVPSQFPAFLQRGAFRGYHVIGLTYINPKSISDICDESDGDALCTGLAREEVLTGNDKSSVISITPENSIEARLVAILKYLALQRPADDWGQYLDAAGSIIWSKVSVSGNSQGAGHAGYIGKVRQVFRVGMYAGPSDWVKKTNQAPSWFSQSSATPSSAYYGYIHSPDAFANRSGDPNQVTNSWGASGLFNMAGALTNTGSGAGSQSPPFNASQRLITSACSTLDVTNQHNCPMFKGNEPAWDYVSFP
jgi:hypothetical protein